MTYRDRRLRKAERLRGWADKRRVKASTARKTVERSTKRIDLYTSNLGTIISVQAGTRRGQSWLADNTDALDVSRDGSIYCDHRCGVEMLQGALAAGLRLQDVPTGRIAGGER